MGVATKILEVAGKQVEQLEVVCRSASNDLDPGSRVCTCVIKC